jgi:hypothetical protein
MGFKMEQPPPLQLGIQHRSNVHAPPSQLGRTLS